MFKLPIFLLLIFSLFISCKPEEVANPNELQDVNFVLSPGNTLDTRPSVTVYPNPFIESVTINTYSPQESPVVIKISDDKGRFKTFIHAGLPDFNVRVNFQNKNATLYICEVLIDNKIYKFNLFKNQ